MGSNSKPQNYIRYVPAQEGFQPKIIRMVEVQKDPMEPAKFRLNQKIPGPPPSPPAPVMHSPPRKITAEEQSKWKIPPCVSGWKNPRGYTVPLDKRCAFSGRNGAQPETINSNFAKLSEALQIANKQAKEALEEKAKAEKLVAQKEKEKNAEKLRMLAQQAREERAVLSRGLLHGRDEDSDEDADPEEVKERARMREDIHRKGIRNINKKASAPGKRTNLDRQRERDISEQIALGMARPNTQDNDVHDQRLYNQSQGIGSGFGEDDDYAVYDKAWKTQASFSTNYRPTADAMQESSDRDTTEKLLPQGSSAPEPESSDALAPIQFDQDDVEAVFKIDSFLKSAKYKANKKLESSSKRRKY